MFTAPFCFGRYLVKVRKWQQDAGPDTVVFRTVGFYDTRVEGINAFCDAFRAEWN